jgi:uncharacterized membrane protein
MRTAAIAYGLTAVIFLALDAVWLRNAADLLYRPALGDLLLERFRPTPAGLFYLVYMAGIVKFAILPAFDTDRWTTALINGACLGFVAYATYDLTNQATLRVWSSWVTIADLCWGTFVTGAGAALGFAATRLIVR